MSIIGWFRFDNKEAVSLADYCARENSAIILETPSYFLTRPPFYSHVLLFSHASSIIASIICSDFYSLLLSRDLKLPSWKMVEKRALSFEGIQSASKSKAARFNAHVLKKLQAAVAEDPEINLAEQFPAEYSQRLMEMRKSMESSPSKPHSTTIQSSPRSHS